MDAPNPFWTARRVFIAGCESPLGSALVEQLIAREADVSILLGHHVDERSPVIEHRLFEKIDVIRGDLDNRTTMTMALSVREAEIVILAQPFSALTVHSLISATRKATPLAALVVTVPSAVSRIVAVAEAFRVAGGNPIGVVSIPESAPADVSAEFLIAHAERVIRREPAALRGVAAFPAIRRVAA